MNKLPLYSEGGLSNENKKEGERLDEIDSLRMELVSYIKRKFYTRRNITDMADEIVNQVFFDVANSPKFIDDRYNFGYMSSACIRAAYKVFHRNEKENGIMISLNNLPLIDEDNFVEEIEKTEDCVFIFQSLQTLKQIEQIIIKERYYGSFSFREISERHNINLNTVLSHHRRALEKLRPILSLYFNYNDQKGGN